MKKISILLIVTITMSTFQAFAQIDVGAPSWSPDGKRIVYTYNDASIADLFIYDFDTKKSERITFSDSLEWTPSWSPDGEKIAYASNESGTMELYAYYVNDKNTKRLTNTNAYKTTPSWSGDSKNLIYTVFNPHTKSRKTFTTDLNGNIKELQLDKSRSYIYPNLTKDGSKLLFGSKSDTTTSSFHIWVKDMMSGNEVQLEDMPLVSYNPSWSYDGSKVLFINQSEQSNTSASIYIMNQDGKELHKLLDCEYGCFQARLSPNGKFVIYKNGWGKNNQGICLFDIIERQTTTLIR